VRAGTEGCDDHNTGNGDGCSSTCTIESGYVCFGSPQSTCLIATNETEPNDDGTPSSSLTNEEPGDFLASAANGPYTSTTLIHGSISVPGDDDVFAITNNTTAPKLVKVDVWNGALGVGVACGTTMDTWLNIRDASSATPLASNDDRNGASDRCSSLTYTIPPMTTVYAQLIAYFDSDVVNDWLLKITVPICGNLVVEAGEECDVNNPALCNATTCQRVPICSDGFIDAPENCDDSNTTNGDGCSSTCQLENVCGNGTRTGSEGCDDGNTVGGDGCSATCTAELGFTCTGSMPSVCASTCGDGIRASTEACDDHNTGNGDGCSSTCAIEPGFVCSGAPQSTCVAVIDETEPNDDGTPSTSVNNTDLGDFLASAANGPYTSSVLLHGAIGVVGDDDGFAFTNNTTAPKTVRFDLYNGALGVGVPCGTSIDTYLNIRDASSATPLASNDDRNGTADECSGLSYTIPAMTTVYAQLIAYGDDRTFPNWLMKVTFPVCGNGIVELPSEECDVNNPTICDPVTCQRVPKCGDSFIDSPEVCDDSNAVSGDGCSSTCQLEFVCGDGARVGAEQCDDHNLTNGDGCSSTCTWETTTEVEPNATTVQADTVLPVITATRRLTAAIGAAGDVDTFKLSVTTATVVRFEVFDATGYDCDSSISSPMSLTLLDSAGTTLKTDVPASDSTQSGIGANCPALVSYLPAGSYYIQAARVASGTIPAYQLDVHYETDDGAELEPNNTRLTAQAEAGTELFVSGAHVFGGDDDWFALTLPAGAKSVRLETVEGNAVSCESQTVDTLIELYSPTGTLLGTDDDDGRGYCSALDGTGAAPRDPGLHNLPAGTYYVRVAQSTLADSTQGTFSYRVQVTIR
jgi:cysteine-rich repeat protein